jgi:hypothetical protein
MGEMRDAYKFVLEKLKEEDIWEVYGWRRCIEMNLKVAGCDGLYCSHQYTVQLRDFLE